MEVLTTQSFFHQYSQAPLYSFYIILLYTSHLVMSARSWFKDVSVRKHFLKSEDTDAVHLSTFTSNLTSQKQVVSKLEIPSPMGALFIWN